jgi:hypothetical protein
MTDFRALCAELLDWAERASAHYVVHPDVILRARAALEAQPEPQGPSDKDLHQLWLDLYAFHDGPTSGDVAEIARAVLARWGHSAIEPVSVSERLPGPKDCDAEGRCWFCTPSSYVMDANCVYIKAEHRRSWNTHWAPHWALPVPGVEGEP